MPQNDEEMTQKDNGQIEKEEGMIQNNEVKIQKDNKQNVKGESTTQNNQKMPQSNKESNNEDLIYKDVNLVHKDKA